MGSKGSSQVVLERRVKKAGLKLNIFREMLKNMKTLVLYKNWTKIPASTTKYKFLNPRNYILQYWIFWFPLGLTSFISLLSKGLSRVFYSTEIPKASVLQCLAFFMVQPSYPYMTIGKTIALAIRTFVSKVMSLLFNTVSRFVIAFLPSGKHLFISWLQSPSTVILEPKQIKSVTVFIFSPSICHEVLGPDAMTLVFLNVEF